MTGKKKAELRLAADVGGTFTDVVLDAGNRRFSTKLLTTPEAPELAVVEGTHTVLGEAGAAFADIGVFVHGTTLATNAVIERKGAKVALIATEGFRDVIEIADESRFDQYDVFIEKTRPLISRQLRFTVPERMDVHGKVRLQLDEAAANRVAEQIKSQGIEAVAIALMHSYVNDAHEVRLRDIVKRVLPGVSITLSSEVCPEAREYERTSTAVLNAYVQPLMAGYLERLAASFARHGYTAPIHLMTSGGNLTSLETAVRFPVRLVESGPAGGAILAARLAAERGEDAILSFDMGGTTAKICLIEHGRPMQARTFEVDRQSRFRKGSGLPVRIPVIEMVEIGAGGGSIARVDQLGGIAVGPGSAGAKPGPACYGQGGTRPTVTDGDLALGKIAPGRFAGGKIRIDPALAASALDTEIGAAMRMTTEMAAFGVSEIVDENMANAARVHAVERGVAIASRTLIAFGGAAPLHAARLAEKLGLKRIIVPADAGVGSAIGFLEAPAAYELVRSRYMRLEAFDAGAASKLLSAMAEEARGLARAAAGGRALSEHRRAFMRYAGQGHEIEVELPNRALLTADADGLRREFEAEYARLFARSIPNAAIEIMSWVVRATTAERAPERLAAVKSRPAPSPSGSRRVFDARLGESNDVPVHERGALLPGSALKGPVLIVEDGTSTFVSSSFDAMVDAGGALVLTAK